MTKMSNANPYQERILFSLLFTLKPTFDKESLIDYAWECAEEDDRITSKEQLATAFDQLNESGRLEDQLDEIEERIEFLANNQTEFNV